MAGVEKVGEIWRCDVCGNVVEVKEAGGGPCGTLPYAAGGVRFRARAGREGIEKLIAKLKALGVNAKWPQQVW